MMFTVRHALPQDDIAIKEINFLATATLREVYRPKPSFARNKISKHLERLVAIERDRIVGAVRYYVEDPILRIIGLNVHPDFRKKGVARELIRALEEIARQQKIARLQLATIKQTGNVEIFRRLGFKIIEEREDNFSESDKYDVLIDVEMEKVL
jgi:ribosomal protein S18 acetylase RimI-like enzyme